MGDLLEFMLVFVPIVAVLGLTIYLFRKRKSWLESRAGHQTRDRYESSGERLVHEEKMRLEERVRVLERIVTDRSHSLEQEIEALRDKPTDAGVPLNIARKETQ